MKPRTLDQRKMTANERFLFAGFANMSPVERRIEVRKRIEDLLVQRKVTLPKHGRKQDIERLVTRAMVDYANLTNPSSTNIRRFL